MSDLTFLPAVTMAEQIRTRKLSPVELAEAHLAKIASPETHLEKTYHVQIATVADEKITSELVSGISSENGDVLKALRTNLLRSGEKNSWLEITLDEGKNRQIRRMLTARNIEVLRLIRVAIGPLHLGKLAKGAHRPLTPEEKNTLDRAMQGQTQ